MRVVFMGTPEFAVQTLEQCILHHEVVAVFTQPDKPKGRGNKLTPSEVKVVAEKHAIPVLQPTKIRKDDWPEQIRKLQPDVIVVVAYGQILSQEILDIPRYGCINVHASLLPKYRGAAPINWAIANGEIESGVTTMQMDAGIDTGDMLLRSKVEITPNMIAQDLHDILAKEGADLLVQTLKALELHDLFPEKQNDALACFAPMLGKEIAKVDWSMSATQISDRIRGFNPWPVAHTTLHDTVLKLYRAMAVQEDEADKQKLDFQSFIPGQIVGKDKKSLYVKTGSGILKIEELQLGSNKRMTAQAFLLGNSVEIGEQLK